MKKKTSRQLLYKRLDDLVRETIKIRDNRTCQRCDKEHLTGLDCQWAHVKVRGKGCKLRWYLFNSFVLCNECHTWWHDFPKAAEEWFSIKFAFRYLYICKKMLYPIVPVKIFELQELVEEHKIIKKAFVEKYGG